MEALAGDQREGESCGSQLKVTTSLLATLPKGLFFFQALVTTLAPCKDRDRNNPTVTSSQNNAILMSS